MLGGWFLVGPGVFFLDWILFLGREVGRACW